MQLSLALLTIAGSLSQVNAHGWLASFAANGVTYPGWAPYSDPYQTPVPVRVERIIAGKTRILTNVSRGCLLINFVDSGPVLNIEGPNITCNNGGNIPTT